MLGNLVLELGQGSKDIGCIQKQLSDAMKVGYEFIIDDSVQKLEDNLDANRKTFTKYI